MSEWPEGLGSERVHRQDGRRVSLTPFVVHLTFVSPWAGVSFSRDYEESSGLFRSIRRAAVRLDSATAENDERSLSVQTSAMRSWCSDATAEDQRQARLG